MRVPPGASLICSKPSGHTVPGRTPVQYKARRLDRTFERGFLAYNQLPQLRVLATFGQSGAIGGSVMFLPGHAPLP